MLSRRHFLAAGAAAALSAPAIVRAPILMPIRGVLLSNEIPYHGFCDRLRVHLYLQPIQAGLLRGRSISEIAVELNTRGRRGLTAKLEQTLLMNEGKLGSRSFSLHIGTGNFAGESSELLAHNTEYWAERSAFRLGPKVGPKVPGYCALRPAF
jgi:hypothetical protein